ncbi:iron-siderophore ABC transporter substrate-binding protein [Devosia faecipullorum]|uniref:iron-siderophore ABC transporter substrate-binding protein n=1 Tax=Devosia faecipullorum TaxID=2755039 RepID=UPI00187BA71D|nr:iron-siderophore ABC transporter substrate-binding protein [Devosia faecipullorum]MBE7731497.1 iron-siderophore ABC transporter substrate-binding protein [Devosia faecipullorum]
MSFRSLLLSALAAFSVVGSAEAQSFPVTIDHAYGETIIEAEPVRIVTWGWANEDAAIALGVIPVGMPFQSYGGGDNGIHPWIEDALAAARAETPAILIGAEGPPVEQIAALRPDLIIAAYSGITEDQYAILSGIAPTIAYSGAPWSTSWQDLTAIVGKALGKEDEAKTLVAETTAWVTAEFAKYPELADVTFASANAYDGSMAVYAPLDARMKFLTDFGMHLDPSVAALAPDSDAFYYSLSYELFDQLEADIFVTYSEDQAALDAWLETPLARNYPPIKNNGLAALVGTSNVAAVSPPSILSLRWGLPAYLDVLGSAARAEIRD